MGHSDRNCKPKTCLICGEAFKPRSGAALYCTKSCKISAARAAARSPRRMLIKRMTNMLASAKHRSSKYSRAFDLDRKFLLEMYDKQDGKCAVTGETFELQYSEDFKHSAASPSLDQIEAGKGYLKDNVRLVTYQCNVALNQWGEERLNLFAKMILDRRSR